MAPKKNEIVWFGMKVSPGEKEKIKKLSQHYDTTQKDIVMNLVEDRIADIEDYEVMEKNPQILKYAGIFDGEESLSTNKKHLANYGRSSTS